MTQLYELTKQYRELKTVEDMDPETLADTLEGLTGEFEDKANAIAIVTNGLASRVAVIDAEIERLNKIKKSAIAQDKSVREYLKTNMQATGITEIKCSVFRITLAKGRDMAHITDESKLPDEYTSVKTAITPDKRKILADLKAGKEIPGASLTKSEQALKIK